jgi:hypothetical protein
MVMVALEYAAPAECPDRAAVIEAIRERSPSVRFEGGASHRFAIAIAQRDDDYVGTVGDREVVAHQCADVVTALALVVSLAIDADAAATAPAPVPTPPPPWQLDGAGAVELGLGITPDPLVTGELEGRARWRDTATLSLAVLAGHDRTDMGGAAASFTLIATRARGCVLPVHGRLELAACAHVEVGAVVAAGEGIAQGRSVTRLWLAPGLDTHIRWPLTARVFAQLEVGASAPLVRDRYLFEPNMTIHQTAAVSGWLGLGVGMQFR